MAATTVEGWQDLPTELLVQAVQSVPGRNWDKLRRVCKQWQLAVDSLIQNLTPSCLTSSWCHRLQSLRFLSLGRLQEAPEQSRLLSISALAACRGLETLVVPSQCISYEASCPALTALQCLTLSGCYNWRPCVQWLLAAPLQRLSLHGCDFAQLSQSEVARLTSLTSLEIEGSTQLHHKDIYLLTPPDLRCLVLRWNFGTKFTPLLNFVARNSHFRQLRHFEYWPAVGSCVREELCAYEALAEMPQLTRLCLHGHHTLDNAGAMRFLPKLTLLQSLDLSNTAVTSSGLHALVLLPQLRGLQLSGCLLTLPASVRAVLTHRPDLTHLDLSDSRVVLSNRRLEPVLPLLADMQSLHLANLRVEEDLTCMSQLQRLRELNLANWHGSDTTAWLSTLTGLTSLNYQGFAEMGAEELAGIASLRSLQELNIAGRTIPSLPDECTTLAKLANLTHLSLSIQHLGYAPAETVFSIREDYRQEVKQKLAPLGSLPLKVLKIWNGKCTQHDGDASRWHNRPSITAASVADRLPACLLRAVINGRLVHDKDGAAYLPT